MNWKQRYVREALVGARLLLHSNADAFAKVIASNPHKALDDAIAEFEHYGVAQTVHVMGATGKTRKVRRIRLELHRQHVKPLTELAAALSHETPAMGSLRIRTLRLRASQVVDRLTAFADAAEPFEARFIAAGSPPDFLNNLRARIHDLEAAMIERIDHTNALHASTIALAGAARHGRRALNLLDAVIQNLVEDEQLRAAWQSVRRIPKKSGPPRGASSSDGAMAGDAPVVPVPIGEPTTAP